MTAMANDENDQWRRRLAKLFNEMMMKAAVAYSYVAANILTWRLAGYQPKCESSSDASQLIANDVASMDGRLWRRMMLANGNGHYYS